MASIQGSIIMEDRASRTFDHIADSVNKTIDIMNDLQKQDKIIDTLGKEASVNLDNANMEILHMTENLDMLRRQEDILNQQLRQQQSIVQQTKKDKSATQQEILKQVDAEFKLQQQLMKNVQEQDKNVKKTIELGDSIVDMHEQYVRVTQQVSELGEETQRVTGDVGGLSGAYSDVGAQVNKANNQTQQAANTTGGWAMKIIALNQALQLTKQLINKISDTLEKVDSYTLTMTRLNMINDGLQTTDELQQKIMGSSNRTRVSYQKTADVISKLGISARDAFNTNDEMIVFAETLQKSFKIAGAETSQIESAMYNLNQAMSSGVLMGNDFKAISDNAPLLAQAIADYMGVSRAELKQLSSQGQITGDIVKNALLGASVEISEEFAKIPRTFEDAKTQIQNSAYQMFLPVMEAVSQLVSSDGFMSIVNTIILGMSLIGQIAVPVLQGVTWLFDILVQTLTRVAEGIMNNEALMLILFTLIGGYGVFVLSKLIGSFVLMGIQAIWSGTVSVAAALKAAAAWALVNWPILAVIAVLGAAMFVAHQAGVSFEEMGAVVGGVFFTLGAFIYNTFIRPLWNYIAAFVNFFANVWHDPVYSIKKLFVDVFSTILDVVRNVAKAIDFLLGTDMSGSIAGFQDSMKSWLGESDKYEAIMPELQEWDYGEAWSSGKQFGSKAVSGVGDLLSGFDLSGKGLADKYGFNDMLSGMDLDSTGSLPVNVKGGQLDKQEVNISEEDLKMLKDVASREFMVNYKQITPNVNISTGDINEASDAQGLITKVKEMMEEELAVLYVTEEA